MLDAVAAALCRMAKDRPDVLLLGPRLFAPRFRNVASSRAERRLLPLASQFLSDGNNPRGARRSMAGAQSRRVYSALAQRRRQDRDRGHAARLLERPRLAGRLVASDRREAPQADKAADRR